MSHFSKYLLIPTLFIIITVSVIIIMLVNNPIFVNSYIKIYSQKYFAHNLSLNLNFNQINGSISKGYTVDAITLSKNNNHLIKIDTLNFKINPFSSIFLDQIFIKDLNIKTNIINFLNSMDSNMLNGSKSKLEASYDPFNFYIENISLSHKDFVTNLIGNFEFYYSDSIRFYSENFNLESNSISKYIEEALPDSDLNYLDFNKTEILVNDSFDEIIVNSSFFDKSAKSEDFSLKIVKDDSLYNFKSEVSYNKIIHLSEGSLDLKNLNFKSTNNVTVNDLKKAFNVNIKYLFDKNYNNDKVYLEIADNFNNDIALSGNLDLFSAPSSDDIKLTAKLSLYDNLLDLLSDQDYFDFNSIKLESESFINISKLLVDSKTTLLLDDLNFRSNSIKKLVSILSFNINKNDTKVNIKSEFNDIEVNGKRFDDGSLHSYLNDNGILNSKLIIKNEFGEFLKLKTQYSHNNYLSIDSLDLILRDSRFSSENIYIRKNLKKSISNNFKVDVGSQGFLNGYMSFENFDSFNFDFNFSNIDLVDINNLLNSNVEYKGIADGKVQAKINGSKPFIMLDLNVENGSYDKIIFDQVSMLGSFFNNKIIINNFIYSHYKDKFISNGWFTGNFNDEYKFSINEDDSLDVDLDLSNFMFSKINRYIPLSQVVNGYGSGRIKVNGLISNPLININVDIDSPVYDKLYGDNMKLRAIYKNHLFYIKQLSLNTQYGKYTASGFMPITKNDLNQSYDVIVTGKSKAFELLEPYISTLDSIRGDISFKLELSGNEKNFKKNGMINFINTNVYYRDLNNYTESLNGTADIINNNLIIKNLSGTMVNKVRNDFTDFGKKIKNFFNIDLKDQAKSNLFINGSINLNSFFDPNYAINISGDNIFLDDSDGRFYGNGDLDIFFIGRDTLNINGSFKPSGYDFKVLEIYSNRLNIDENLNTYTNKSTNVDIQLLINDPIKVETENFNLAIDGDVNMISKNNSDITFAGKLSIIDGKFYDNQGNVFKNTNGEIILNPVDENPFVDIHTQTSISDEIIELSLSGFTDNPNLILESTSDKFTQTDILELLTFRVKDSESEDEDRITRFFANYIEKEIERNITKYSVLDEFEFRSDKSIASNDNETDLNLFLGKQLSNKIYLNTEFPIDDMNKMQYQVIYRINKNMSVVARVDDEKYWHLNYKIKYYY